MTCNGGFEACCAGEVAALGGKPAGQGKGFVLAEGPYQFMYVLNRFGRTFDRVFIEMTSANVASEDVVSELLAGCDLGLLGHVSSVTLGADEFVSRIRPRWITQLSSILPRKFGSEGKIRMVRGRSDVSLSLSVDGQRVSLYADTTGESLNFREYRVYNHPSSIRPTLAASLAIMAKPQGGILYDPFCGGGTLLIEAALMSSANPTHFRRGYRYQGFVDFDPKVEDLARPAKAAIPGFETIMGTDINGVHLKGCRKNLMAARLPDVVVALGDSTKTVLTKKADVIVTNPPYGVKGAKLNRVSLLNSRFLENLPNTLNEGGRAVVLTSDFESFKRLLKAKVFRLEDVARTLHGHLWVEGIAFSLIAS